MCQGGSYCKWLLHVTCFKQDSQDSYSLRKVMRATMCGSVLKVNYTGYQNSRLVHKQPADSAAPGRHVVVPQVICSKPRPQV